MSWNVCWSKGHDVDHWALEQHDLLEDLVNDVALIAPEHVCGSFQR